MGVLKYHYIARVVYRARYASVYRIRYIPNTDRADRSVLLGIAIPAQPCNTDTTEQYRGCYCHTERLFFVPPNGRPTALGGSTRGVAMSEATAATDAELPTAEVRSLWPVAKPAGCSSEWW